MTTRAEAPYSAAAERAIRIPWTLTVAAVLTLAVAITAERCSRRALQDSLVAHPPFQVPDETARRRALGPTEGLPEPLRLALRDDAFEPMPKPAIGDWLFDHEERGQTFEEFARASPSRPDAVRSTLYIQPLGEFVKEAPSPDALARFAQAYFAIPVKALPPRDVTGLGVTDRVDATTSIRQLLTGDVLRFLRARLPADAFGLVSFTLDDLYPDERWNFVFGESSPKDRVGVFSLLRLFPSYYGKTDPDAERLVRLRSAKVLVHETGHLFGLANCTFYRCVMNGANHLVELDGKPLHLCPVCLRKVHSSIGFDVAERDRRLEALAKEYGFDDAARFHGERAKRLE